MCSAKILNSSRKMATHQMNGSGQPAHADPTNLQRRGLICYRHRRKWWSDLSDKKPPSYPTFWRSGPNGGQNGEMRIAVSPRKNAACDFSTSGARVEAAGSLVEAKPLQPVSRTNSLSLHTLQRQGVLPAFARLPSLWDRSGHPYGTFEISGVSAPPTRVPIHASAWVNPALRGLRPPPQPVPHPS